MIIKTLHPIVTSKQINKLGLPLVGFRWKHQQSRETASYPESLARLFRNMHAKSTFHFLNSDQMKIQSDF
jgi:hypothetical protein